MTAKRMAVILISLFTASGCMTLHDPKIAKTKMGEDCKFGDGAFFSNIPYYSTEESVSPVGGLGKVFGWYGNSVDRIWLNETDDVLQISSYDSAGNELNGKKLSRGKDYRVTGRKLVIDGFSRCSPGEAGIGCVWSHIELSCIPGGDLAVKHVTRGAGVLVLVVPIGTSSSYLGLYRRLVNE